MPPHDIAQGLIAIASFLKNRLNNLNTFSCRYLYINIHYYSDY